MTCQNSYKLRQKINISGKTTDDKKVLSNAFIFMSTLGLPLNILLEELDKNDFVIDWYDFCERALKDGWKKSTIYNKIGEGIVDLYSKEDREEFLIKIKFLLENEL